jgi:hypothetical protein
MADFEAQDERTFTEEDRQALSAELAATGLFKPKTEYLLIGDEPQGGFAVVDLASTLSADEVANLKKFLTFMPRSILKEWFMKVVWPKLPGQDFELGEPYFDEFYGVYRQKKRTEDMMWAAFIDLFNQANLAYVNEKQIEPWTWEQEKLESYLLSQNEDQLNELGIQIEREKDIDLGLDPKAVPIMEAYSALPKLGDLGLEINRQNSVKQLLIKKEYVLAQAIVDAYRYASETELGPILTEPLPFDVIVNGTTIFKTPGG